jgi:Flp pilus assembly protein TadG
MMRKGHSLVEFALTLPIFFFILFGMIELVLLGHNYLLVASTAQEAARFGATGAGDDEILEFIDRSLDRLVNTYLLKGVIGEVRILPREDERRVGIEIVVKIDYSVFVNIGWMGLDILHVDLPAKARMPVEMDLWR